MKRLFIAFLFSCVLIITCQADAYNVTIKKIYETPSTEAKLIFDIPIEVTLLDISEDRTWFKVKIAYYIGPFLHEYIGWTNVTLKRNIIETVLPTSEIILSTTEAY
jgi:hypothetical protein